MGWTIIVWFLVLAWACNGDTYQKSIAEKADEIKKLAELKEKGALTEEEFNTQKKSNTKFVILIFSHFLRKKIIPASF